MTGKACKACRMVSTEEVEKCPNCGSSELSAKFSSQIIIFDPEKSKMAEKLGAKVPGRYAVRIK
jgi:DNA-directed RNA polymerase subunit E"